MLLATIYIHAFSTFNQALNHSFFPVNTSTHPFHSFWPGGVYMCNSRRVWSNCNVSNTVCENTCGEFNNVVTLLFNFLVTATSKHRINSFLNNKILELTRITHDWTKKQIFNSPCAMIRFCLSKIETKIFLFQYEHV